MRSIFITLLIIVFFGSCNQAPKKRFTEILPEWSHIDFRNDVKEDEFYNILTYEYLYNGGGVAVGDLNGDGLPDLMFTGNMVPNKLYLNKGNFQFQDITDKAGVAGRSKWKTGVVMADVNGDGLLDIYVCYSGPGSDADRRNELYINQGLKDGLPVFKESAQEYGLGAPGTYTTTVVFFDMDNDGDLDMLMVNHADMFYNPYFKTDKLRSTRNPKFGNRLYRNDNGHFTDISEQAHIDGSGLNFGLSASISDVNNDGWADIYVTNDYDERDFLYLNNHDGTFREVLSTSASHISEFAMGSDIADYNNDGLPDIMVLDMLPENNHRQKLLKGADGYDKYMMRAKAGFHLQQMRNTLQLNNGNDSSGAPIFSEVGQFASVSATDWSWSPLFADFDNDGWKDLFISDGIFRDITNLDFVKYTSGYSAQYIQPDQDKTQMWELVQKMPSTKLSNYLYKNNHELGFTNVTEDWGLTKKSVNNGAAYADLNNDGNLDLIINNLNDKATVYKNAAPQGTSAHYIKIRLKGKGKNTFGIGAKVFVRTAHGKQMQEEYTSRGFQSSVDPIMHIGLGADSIIQSIKVKWVGGKESKLQNIKADTLLIIDENGSSESIDSTKSSKVPPLFKDITDNIGFSFADQQSTFVDFKISPLLPYQLSKIGPCIAKGDVNGDGLEDLFVGGTSGKERFLYLQNKEGKFVLAANQPWNNNKTPAIADALFFDADGDGDLDLYLVSGGADFPLNDKNYQDLFFENDGHGNFKELPDALPTENQSGTIVRAADINKDGLPDLFIGSGYKPGFFPESSGSFILLNKSVPGKIKFEKDRTQTDSCFTRPGMVTDALWLDINKDGQKDLILVGQFMPITVLENHHGKLVNATEAYGLSGTSGWWCRLAADDFDNDGDTDIVVGNLGLNTQFNASAKEPFTVTYSDFFNNGIIEPIICYYNQGISYPYLSRDEMVAEMPVLQKKFLHYADYADATLNDVFTHEQLQQAKTVDIKNLQSVFLKNEGNKKFTITTLPASAQLSAINGIMSMDVDHDGNKDIVLAGNFYPFRVQMGPSDAGIGLVLKGDGKGNFQAMPYSESGLLIKGDVRNLIGLRTAKGMLLVAAKNNGLLQMVELINK
ncbi:MAG: VCBS repeat-containing protein [Bacteroidetes bacterium]|nr:VCBS repeat-containing protein [Bacteroidota bacterium]